MAVGALVLGVAGCVALRHAKPFLVGDGCQATVLGQAIQLDAEQAAVAATIAGVGYRRGVPQGAVTVAYATALQESKMHNIDYGDRDSVGIFQQRPSQGWGTRSELQDPVYAATKFFAALVKVPGYLHMPVYRAAQAVQHSADGSAYGQYEQVAGMLSTAFTGSAARSVWCWYTPYKQHPAQLASAGKQLERTFGHLTEAGSALAPSGELAGTRATGRAAVAIQVPAARTGWAVAAWSVAHAKTYGIRQIRFAGYEWLSSSGEGGWKRDRGVSGSRVELD
jgi:hypothetical protein